MPSNNISTSAHGAGGNIREQQPRPLLLNFLEKLPGKVTRCSASSDDPTYFGSTANGGEQYDYSSD